MSSNNSTTPTYVSLLGRQPELSLAELEQVFTNITVHGDDAATFEHNETPDIQRLGGATKLGEVVAEFEFQDWTRLSKKIVQHYTERLRSFDGKVTIGISVYGQDIHPRDIQRTGLTLKTTLKRSGVSMRLIPNDFAELSTATSHHNKLGLSPNKIELLVIYGDKSVLVAESLGTQNITALAARDQARPKTDAFVGMLPPKLALMMINLSGIGGAHPSALLRSQFEASAPPPKTRLSARDLQVSSQSVVGSTEPSSGMQPESASSRRVMRSDEPSDREGDVGRLRVLDPFCGTGVVLQEAALLGFDVYGTDLAEKMVDYSKANLEWLGNKHAIGNVTIEAGDAVEHNWQPPISAVVAESYLGQPFSAPPAPDKLDKVRRTVDTIVDGFLKNLANQIKPGTPICLAIPAWRGTTGQFTHLPVVLHLEALGYEWQQLKNVDTKRLIYYREDQIVARQLLLLNKK